MPIKTSIKIAAAALTLLLLAAEQSRQALPVRAEDGARITSALVPGPDGWAQVGRSVGWTLHVNTETGEFYAQEPESGTVWLSNPGEADREADEIAGSKNRALLASGMEIRYVNALNNENISASYTAAYKKGGIKVEGLPGGALITYTFVDEKITIPLAVTLEEGQVVCEVRTAEIREEGNSRLLGIRLLPYFGAGGPDEEGFLLVPDGSGALIRFNNGRQLAGEFSMPLYGRDLSLGLNKLTYESENAMLPVFGIKKEGGAMLAVITDGEAGASIAAFVSGKRSSYNAVYADFTLRSGDTYSIGSSVGTKKEIKSYQTGSIGYKRLRVCYRFLKAGEADTAGMAASYRQFLLENGTFKKQEDSSAQTFCLQLVGGVRKDAAFLGIPVKRVEALTAFSEAEALLERLADAGVERPVIRYRGWSRDELDGKIDKKAVPASALGGGKAFRSFLEVCRRQGAALYLNMEFQSAARWSGGYNAFFHAARSVQGTPVDIDSYDIATQRPLADQSRHLLSPSIFEEIASAFSARLLELGADGIEIGSASSSLYSDFAAGYTRQDSAGEIAGILDGLRKKGMKVTAGGAGAYALPYAAFLADVPTTASGFDIEDEAVPFYQMVVKGYIPYCTKPINLAGDSREAFLEAMETGSIPQFLWIGADAAVLQDTPYTRCFSPSPDAWMEEAVEDYRLAQALAEKTVGQTIVRHERQGMLTATQYENGVLVLVNYALAPAVYGEHTVMARDCLIVD